MRQWTGGEPHFYTEKYNQCRLYSGFDERSYGQYTEIYQEIKGIVSLRWYLFYENVLHTYNTYVVLHVINLVVHLRFCRIQIKKPTEKLFIYYYLKLKKSCDVAPPMKCIHWMNIRFNCVSIRKISNNSTKKNLVVSLWTKNNEIDTIEKCWNNCQQMDFNIYLSNLMV